MRPSCASVYVLLAALLAGAAARRAVAFPTALGTSFSYQGQLKSGGSPVNSTADFQVTLWDALSGGTQIGGPASANNITIADGQFTTQIDFGAVAFNGQARWLEIAVRSPAGSGAFITLSPRQPLTATPYALQTRGIITDASGNVSIGASNSWAKLNVSVPSPSFGIRHTDGNVDLSTYIDGAAGWFGTVTTHPLYFYTHNGPAYMAITTLGRVGIGTTTPNEKLTVAGSMEIGTSSGDYQHLRIGGGNSNGFLYGSYPHFGDGIHMGYNYYADGSGNDQVIHSDGGTSRLSLGYGTAVIATAGPGGGEPVNRFVVDPNGNASITGRLGIGTTTPIYSLDVATNAHFSGGVFTEFSGAGYAMSAVGHFNGGGWFEANSNGVAAVRGENFSPGGSLAFGVYGASHSPAGWDFYANGAGDDYGSPSSIRWKRNIEAIDDPLDKLEQMRGVFFDWDEAHGGRHAVGMIGEEVGKVLPEIVSYEADGVYVTGMDYSKLTPLLVEAVKALRFEKDNQLAERDEQIAALQHENQQLQDRLAALEGAVARFNELEQAVHTRAQKEQDQ